MKSFCWEIKFVLTFVKVSKLKNTKNNTNESINEDNIKQPLIFNKFKK